MCACTHFICLQVYTGGEAISHIPQRLSVLLILIGGMLRRSITQPSLGKVSIWQVKSPLGSRLTHWFSLLSQGHTISIGLWRDSKSLWRLCRLTEWGLSRGEGDGHIWCLSRLDEFVCWLSVSFLSVASRPVSDSTSGDGSTAAPVQIIYVSDWTAVRCWPFHLSKQMFLEITFKGFLHVRGDSSYSLN